MPRRRGRRPARPDPGSGPVGAFADGLWQLRLEAGDPSYEEMAGRLGAAASKSSLAAAAQGRSLPSWETTWEFVRVLAVDRLGHEPARTEEEWRGRWQQARHGAPSPTPAALSPTPEMPARQSDSRHLGRTWLAAALAALISAVLTFVVLEWRKGDAGGTPAAAQQPERDDSLFEGDITYPDGSVVPPATSFTKVWRLRNNGTIFWANRFLARLNDEPCTAPDLIEIPQTAPGESVDISVTVRTPGRPGRCKIFWKMVDEQGRMLFPAKRPVFLDVRVGGL